MRPIPILTLLTLGAGLALAATTPRKSSGFAELISQGRAAFLASDFDRAASSYGQACSADSIAAYAGAKAILCESLLASVDEARGNLLRAEQRYVHAAASAEEAGSAYQSLYCARLIDLGEFYRRRGQSTQAEQTLVKSVGIARALVHGSDLLPEALIRLGGLYSESAQPERGRAPINEALAIVDGAGSPLVNEVAYAHKCLGMIDLSTGNLRDAEASLRDSLALATAALGEDHPVNASYQASLALVLLAQRKYDSAALLLRRAQFVIESHPDSHSSDSEPFTRR